MAHSVDPDQTFLGTAFLFSLWGTDTLSGEETLSKLFCLLSEKGSTLQGKNLLQRIDSFSEGDSIWCVWRKANRKSQRLSPL